MKFFSSPLNRIRALLIVFMFGLVLSGLSAVPAQWETEILKNLLGSGTWFSNFLPEVSTWVDRIYEGVQSAYGQYPFLAYPNDWLAFGHVAIAVAFVGPLRDPIKNIWVVEFGMIICALVIPWAVIFSLLRHIPFFWTLIDTSFGLVGITPLWLAHREILLLKPELLRNNV